MTVSDYVVRFLHKKGVGHVFELSGGMITRFLDSLHNDGRIRIVSVHHEQAAAFAADAMGRMTGIPGVAMATSGPGATNLLTGIGSCYFDSSPAVFITGQVNRNEQKGNRKIRQLGFQETDIVAMAGPITKAAWRVERASQVPTFLEEAFHLATRGRPGPVLVDIPMDVQREEIESPAEIKAQHVPSPAPIDCRRVCDLLLEAKRPLLLAGGGVRAARVGEDFRRLVDLIGVPVVNSLMAVDALPYSHPCRVGMIGTYGNRWANLALSQCDLLIVLGSRLDVRQTGSRVDAFKAGRTIVHVDCEEGETNNRVSGCEAIVAELGAFLSEFTKALQSLGSKCYDRWPQWKLEIEELRDSWPDIAELEGRSGINPNELMHQISRHSGAASAFVVDVGQHQMWAAQSLELSAGQRFITSGGMGSMGFALPASIGAALGASNQPVVVIAGDGGLQCNIQELQTVERMRLPLKIIVLNNQCHGMVRQFQESYFDGRYQSTFWGYSAPDFAKVSSAYGVCGTTIESSEQVDAALGSLWADPCEPRLLQVMIDPLSNVYPKVAFGQPISEMEPQFKPSEIEST